MGRLPEKGSVMPRALWLTSEARSEALRYRKTHAQTQTARWLLSMKPGRLPENDSVVPCLELLVSGWGWGMGWW